MATRVIFKPSQSDNFFLLRGHIPEAHEIEVNMGGTKRVSLNSQKKFKRKKYRRYVRNIVAYLKSDGYLFAPLFSKFPLLTTQIQTHLESSKTNDVSVAGFEVLGIKKVIKKKRRMSEKVKEYLKSDCHMYGPNISLPPKLGASPKGKLQNTNLVTMEVSTSTTTMKEDNNNYRNLRSDIAEQTLLNGRINSPKGPLAILEGQRTGISPETDVSPAFSTVPEKKMVKPTDQRRVTIE